MGTVRDMVGLAVLEMSRAPHERCLFHPRTRTRRTISRERTIGLRLARDELARTWRADVAMARAASRKGGLASRSNRQSPWGAADRDAHRAKPILAKCEHTIAATDVGHRHPDF